MIFQLPRSLRVIVLFTLFSTSGSLHVHAGEIRPEFLRTQEPTEKPKFVWVLSAEALPLWRKALGRSEFEVQRQAAYAIARAHEMGYEGMEAAVPELEAVLYAPKSHFAARFAAAYALISLDQKNSANSLFSISQQQGKDLRQLIEPTLAHWNFVPIREVWHRRIADITSPRRDLMLAINGVAEEHDTVAIDDLLRWALPSDRPPDIRLAAARAVGRISSEGLEDIAEKLTKRQPASTLDRLCAVALLTRHQTPKAIELLEQLANDNESAIVAETLRVLYGSDPKHVLFFIEKGLKHSDSNVRKIVIQTCVALPTPERIALVADRLNDPHPDLRSLVRESFFSLSQNPELSNAIRQSSTDVLNGDDWRGQEQAALLFGALDYKPAAERLVQLLSSQRPEVMVSTAWALRSLSLPDTLERVLEFAKQRSKSEDGLLRHIDHQMGHLFELFGVLRYQVAVPLLLEYVPKRYTEFGENSRSCAIWALGLIQEGKGNSDLAEKLMDRIKDTMGIPPEVGEVRHVSALTIGRLKATSQVGPLKKEIGDRVDNNPVDFAMRWAVLKISGEALPLPEPDKFDQMGWFIEPLSTKETTP